MQWSLSQQPPGHGPDGQSGALRHRSTEPKASKLLTLTRKSKKRAFVASLRNQRPRIPLLVCEEIPTCFLAPRMRPWLLRKKERESIFSPPLSVPIRGIFARFLYPKLVPNSGKERGREGKKRKNQ